MKSFVAVAMLALTLQNAVVLGQYVNCSVWEPVNPNSTLKAAGLVVVSEQENMTIAAFAANMTYPAGEQMPSNLSGHFQTKLCGMQGNEAIEGGSFPISPFGEPVAYGTEMNLAVNGSARVNAANAASVLLRGDNEDLFCCSFPVVESEETEAPAETPAATEEVEGTAAPIDSSKSLATCNVWINLNSSFDGSMTGEFAMGSPKTGLALYPMSLSAMVKIHQADAFGDVAPEMFVHKGKCAEMGGDKLTTSGFPLTSQVKTEAEHIEVTTTSTGDFEGKIDDANSVVIAAGDRQFFCCDLTKVAPAGNNAGKASASAALTVAAVAVVAMAI